MGKLVEAQVRQLLGEDKNSEIEQSWDEYDKSSNNNNINKAAKFSPVLAKDYNHNVEDGREGAEDYCRYGLEEKIRSTVKNIISEKYSTPDLSATHTANTIHYGRDWNTDISEYEIEDYIDLLHEYLSNAGGLIQNYVYHIDANYYKTMMNHINKLIKMCDRIGNKVIMNQGEQPDDAYDDRHMNR